MGEPGRDLGRFADYSDADLLGQLRMEARGQLDPEYCQFLWAVVARFKDLTTAGTDALREAAEKLDAHADMMEGPHIVQDATAKIMATATRDCAAIVRSLIKEPTQ